VDAIRQNCIKHVEFHQPIPEEVLQEARAALPAEWFNESTTVSSVTTTNAPDELDAVFTDTLRRLKEIDCPFNCNENGQCQNGITIYFILLAHC